MLPCVVEGAGKERGAVRAILSDRSVASVIALALFLNLGTGIVLPILPLFARSFGVDYGQAGLLVGAFYFARLMSDLAAGGVIKTPRGRPPARSGVVPLSPRAVVPRGRPRLSLPPLCLAPAGVPAG